MFELVYNDVSLFFVSESDSNHSCGQIPTE